MGKDTYFDPQVAVAALEAEEIKEHKKAKRKTLVQAIKYAICTASAGLIEFITFTIFMAALPIPEDEPVWFITQNDMLTLVSTVISLTLSILWNFTINRKFTFKSAGNVPRAMILAFVFYIPFFPFKVWFNSYMPGYLGIDPFIVEVITMLLNGVLEFCWQKFVIYRKEADSALAKYDVGTVGEFGEIAVEKPEVNGMQMLELMRAGVDIGVDDKQLKKELKAIESAN